MMLELFIKTFFPEAVKGTPQWEKIEAALNDVVQVTVCRILLGIKKRRNELLIKLNETEGTERTLLASQVNVLGRLIVDMAETPMG